MPLSQEIFVIATHLNPFEIDAWNFTNVSTSLVHLAAPLMYSFENDPMSPLSILCPWKFLNSVKTWFRDNSKNIQSYCPLRKEMLVIATALKTYHKRWRLWTFTNVLGSFGGSLNLFMPKGPTGSFSQLLLLKFSKL